MADKEIRINLIEKDRRVLVTKKTIATSLLITVFILSGMLYSYYHARAQLKNLQAEIDRLNNEYYPTEACIQDWEEKKSGNDLLQEKINTILCIQKRRTSTLGILEEIEKVMPPGITLTNIEVSIEKVTLKGCAPAHTPEALLLCGLRNSKLFGDVVMVVSGVNEKAGEVLFEVAVAREDGEQKY